MDTNIVDIKCLSMMMLIRIRQNLSNIWSSIHEKVKRHWGWVEKKALLLKKSVQSILSQVFLLPFLKELLRTSTPPFGAHNLNILFLKTSLQFMFALVSCLVFQKFRSVFRTLPNTYAGASWKNRQQLLDVNCFRKKL